MQWAKLMELKTPIALGRSHTDKSAWYNWVTPIRAKDLQRAFREHPIEEQGSTLRLSKDSRDWSRDRSVVEVVSMIS